MPGHAENATENILNTIVETITDDLPKQKSVRFFHEENAVSAQMNRLLGRQNAIHRVLGGGKFSMGAQINQFLGFIQDVACQRNLKQFVMVVLGLWAAAIIGSWCNFFTVIYISKRCLLI